MIKLKKLLKEGFPDKKVDTKIIAKRMLKDKSGWWGKSWAKSLLKKYPKTVSAKDLDRDFPDYVDGSAILSLFDGLDEGKLNEDKAAQYEKLRKNFEKTYKAYWDAVNDFQLALKKQGKKKEEMMIHRKYAKEVLGFHAWMRQWIRKAFF